MLLRLYQEVVHVENLKYFTEIKKRVKIQAHTKKRIDAKANEVYES